MNAYQKLQSVLVATPRKWLVTGVAGFIGSNLLESLLKLNQTVVGLDNFSTGHQHNLNEVRALVTSEQWSRFHFTEGDICDTDTCHHVVKDCDYVLHQAALGSVPRSIADPVATNANNISGFLNMLAASRDAGVKSFTYAASRRTYGDHPALPKVEDVIGNPLSPYAVTKFVNELYADVFARCYGFNSIGLRYFNVFGPRQDPNGAYAAVIPRWMSAALKGEPIQINGDGQTSRDFCFIENAVQANILAATRGRQLAGARIYNVAVGERTSLLELHALILQQISSEHDGFTPQEAVFAPFREGDVRHSQASIERIKDELLYVPKYNVHRGLTTTARWFRDKESRDTGLES